MNNDSRYEAWKCKVCGKQYVVPDLARGCEVKHHDAAKERLTNEQLH
jgi:transposase-like protein